ncbi:hypothetical protein CR513_11599, partial [Mucuna pruriens]
MIVLNVMHGFSTADGFVEISNCLAEMIKYVANEPAAGLFFIQQHTQSTVPNVIKLKNNLVDKSRETSLHKEDLEDSVAMVRSMKECGLNVADEMIGDIKKSLETITKNSSIDYLQESNYFSSVFKFSRHKTKSLSWIQFDYMEAEKPQLHRSVSSSDVSANTTASSQTDSHLLSNQIENESQPQLTDIGDKLLSLSQKFDDFKATKQAELEEWLQGNSNHEENQLEDPLTN